jgi:hypothetical protein
MRFSTLTLCALCATLAAFAGCNSPGAGNGTFQGGAPSEDAAQAGTYSGIPTTDYISSAPRAIITPADTLVNAVVGDVPGMGTTIDVHLGPNLGGYHLTGTAKYIGGYNGQSNQPANAGYVEPDDSWNLTTDGMFRWMIAYNGGTGQLALVVRQGGDPGNIVGEWVLTNNG